MAILTAKDTLGHLLLEAFFTCPTEHPAKRLALDRTVDVVKLKLLGTAAVCTDSAKSPNGCIASTVVDTLYPDAIPLVVAETALAISNYMSNVADLTKLHRPTLGLGN